MWYMEILTMMVNIISWCVVLLGVYCDVFSLYCIIRVAINPCFRTSPIPFVGLILYLLAANLGFANACIMLILCCLDILISLLSFIVALRVLASTRKRRCKE